MLPDPPPDASGDAPPAVEPPLAPPAREPDLLPLDPAVRNVWRAHAALLWGPLALGVLILEVATVFRPIGPFPFALTLVALAGAALAVGVAPVVRYRYWRHAATEEALFAERGWFTRVRTVVPLRRVQHLDVAESVFEREAGLARLVVHTAGTRNNTVVVPGLRRERAVALRDAMRAYLAEDAL
jgi:uncharacterized protein